MTLTVSDLQQPKAQELVCFPASYAQQRLWFIDQLTPGKATYNLPSALRVRGKLDLEILERTLQEVVRRHETLRTRFVAVGGEPQQVIEDQIDVPLTVLDLTSLATQSEREAAAMRLAQEEAQTPFNLKQAPLFRGKLLRLSALNHVLLFTMHHIISDAWSMGVLIEEVSVLYDAFSRGRSSPLLELPIQYADFTMWQREWLEGGVLEQQLAYWKQQLAGNTELQLPTDRPRSALQNQNGATFDFVIGANVTQGLKKLADEQGATLFMVLLAAFQTLLYRYSGQDDIAVGTPTAGRSRGETEKLIGFFINTLVLRTDLSGNPSFTQLLQRTKEITLEAYAHEDVPFEKLVEVLSPERNLGSTPLFQVMMVLQNAPQSDLRLGSATLAPFNTVDNGTSKFDLLLQLGEDPSGKLVSSLQYSTDLFDAPTIRRMIEHYRRLLSGIAVKPSQSIDVLPYLTTEEHKQVIEEWNRTIVEFPRRKCLPSLIEEQVARTPEGVAVEHQGQKLTYRELNARANQLAWRLRELGVGAETRVGVLVERSLEMVVGLLGVLKAGGAYVPLDPEYPPERLSYMLESSQIKVLLTQQRLREQMPSYSGEVLELDGPEEQRRIAEHKTENPDVLLLPENLAYLIYTSGSTGRPKGVMNTHGGLLNRLLWMQEEYRLGPGDVVLQKTPFSFDVSVWEFFWPLMEGAKLVMARPGGHQDPNYLATLINEQQITTLHFVPSMLAVFLDDEERPKQCKSLRRVVCSGEALPQELARRCLASMPWAELHNLYGPTEAAIDVTYWKCLADDTQASVPIGKPIANMRVYVVDKGMEPVPVGVPGELCLAGVGLARGYWDRGDLTAERFVADGLSGRRGERLYRTGDLVRWLKDGNLGYLGRLDHQIKIRGFRIELGEIEAALQEHESVRQAVVIAREDETGDKRLVAYVVPEEESEESNNGGQRVGLRISELQEHLRGKLPEYMVPRAYVQLEKLPLNQNGKIERKKLPQPENQPEQEYVAPRNSTEETLCLLWQDILRREHIGIHDNFFTLGGHSLMAIRVATRIRESFKLDIPLRQLFELPTIAQLAEAIDRTLQTTNRPPSHLLPTIKQVTRKTALLPLQSNEEAVFFPASFAQTRLWFIDQLTPGKATYNLPGALRVRGKLDVEVLERTVQEAVRRHETLRTRFVAVSGEPQQVIEDQADVQLQVLDLTGIAGKEEREAEAMRLAQEEARTPFNLKQAPLFRGKLLRLDALNHVLLFTMHHIISDAWSMGVLIEEVSIIYEAFSTGRPSPLPELPIQYADYSMWQRECLEGGVLEQQLSYWKQQLAGVSVLQLTTDRPRPTAQTQNGATRDFVVEANITQQLKRLAKEQGATLFMVLLAAFQALLCRYTRQYDIAAGTPIAGRRSSDTEKLIGFFINTLVLRVDLSGAPSFIELVQRVKKVTLEAYAHQDISFEKLVEVLSPERNLGNTPLFQVMFGLQNAPEGNLRLGSAEFQPFDAIDNGTSKFDLLLQHAEDRSGKLFAGLQYSTDIFAESTIIRLIRHYLLLLNEITVAPQKPIQYLELMSAAERRMLLEDFNATASAIPETTVIQLFEEQVNRTPKATAVQYREDSLSYHDLNYRANQLARRLRDLGVDVESRVGLLMEQSLEMVVGLLAALKAGAAYVPLDPDYLPERLTYVLQGAQITVILLQERLREKLAAYGGQVVVLDEDEERSRIAGQKGQNLEVELQPEHPAYIAYTSGSTGRLRGVINTHGGLMNELRWLQEEYRLEAGEIVLQNTPFSFDVSVREVLWPLLEGAQLVMAVPGGHKNPQYLAALIQEQQITTVHFALPMLSAFLEEVKTRECKSLRRVMCGGEALPQELARRCLASMPWAELHHLYGPTEAAIRFTYCKCLAENSRTSVPIGKPIANMRVYVVDEELEMVPLGVPGELCLGGVGLPRGYWGRGDLTAEQFVPDRLSGRSGERLYRTGDLVRWIEDGNLEYLGPLDHQVKICGFHIQLSEIEAALQEHSSVRQAVVIAREDETGDKQRLVAYVALELVDGNYGQQSTESLWMNPLREHLQARLPEYMVPGLFVQLHEFELDFDGKIDRRALEISTKEMRRDEAYVAPQTPEEKFLAELWADILRVERVGIHDNFFSLGGHSLGVTQVIARIREGLSLEVPTTTMFEQPTIAGLAKKLHDTGNINGNFTPPPIGRYSRNHRLPLSFAQQRIWFLDQIEPGSRVHHIPTLLRLKGALDIKALSAALDEIVRRHEILRTSFPADDGHPYQKISPPAHVVIEQVELRDGPREFREENLRRLADLHVQQPFDLAQGPMFRVALYRMEEQEHVLCLTVHHIICDAWSVPIIIRELNVLYSTFLDHGTSPLPDLPLQYADVAAWEREWLRDEVLEGHVQYWRKTLEGAPQSLDLPTDFPGSSVRSLDAGRRILRLPPQHYSELKKLSRQLGATEFMTLLALMNVWLFRYSGQSDILIGSPVSNRTQLETEGLIGIFLNTLVFRTRVEAQLRFTQLVDQVRLNAVGAYAHQALPFEKLVEELQVVRDPGKNPLFQVMFNMPVEISNTLDFAGLVNNEAIEIDAGQARFDLHLNALPTDAGLELTLTYNCGLFQQSTITAMLESYAELVRVAVENPELTISELVEKAGRFEQENALARKRSHSQQQAEQLRTVRRVRL